MPKACASLTIMTEEFAPVSYEELQLSGPGALDLGIADLTKGASVLARLTSTLDGRELPGAEVRLVPEKEARSFVEQLFRTKMIAANAPNITDEAGWLRASGLAGGSYYLHSLAAGEQYGAFSNKPLQLRPGVELFADTVPIEPPGSLEVLLRGIEFLSEEIEVAEVLATGQGNCGWYVGAQLSGQLLEDRVFFPELPAGTWQISAVARLEGPGSPVQRLASFATHVEPGQHRERRRGSSGRRFPRAGRPERRTVGSGSRHSLQRAVCLARQDSH